MARGRGGQPADLGRVLEKLATALGLKARLEKEMVLLAWPAAVGKDIARNTRAQELRGGVLIVGVRTSAWANQLAFLKDDMIRKLNERAKAVVVRDIRWVNGLGNCGRGLESDHRNAHDPAIDDHPAIPLTAKEFEQAEALAAHVADEPLRGAWRQFITGELSRRALRREAGWKPCPVCSVLHHRGPEPCPACRYSV